MYLQKSKHLGTKSTLPLVRGKRWCWWCWWWSSYLIMPFPKLVTILSNASSSGFSEPFWLICEKRMIRTHGQIYCYFCRCISGANVMYSAPNTCFIYQTDAAGWSCGLRVICVFAVCVFLLAACANKRSHLNSGCLRIPTGFGVQMGHKTQGCGGEKKHLSQLLLQPFGLWFVLLYHFLSFSFLIRVI